MVNFGNRLVPSLFTQDLPETLRFYTAVLGFRLTGCHPDAAAPRWAEVTRDGVALQFYAEEVERQPDRPILSGTLYIFPASVSELARELSGRTPFEWGPEVMEYGMREFAIRDPNGYILAFSEPA